MIYVKPRAGLKVRDPQSLRHLAEAGKLVPESAYWLRRIQSGDVVVSPAPVVPVEQIPDSEDQSPQGEEKQ